MVQVIPIQEKKVKIEADQIHDTNLVIVYGKNNQIKGFVSRVASNGEYYIQYNIKENSLSINYKTLNDLIKDNSDYTFFVI